MASDVVTKTSLSTQKAATDLQNASNQQLENMFMLSQRVATMSHQNREALKKVSAAVSDSKRATDVSADGIETIRVAIGGILMLRDQIHSASRRIKKLGETSQRIGESVHLMGDITDETNRLALNTAIQASAGSYANDVGLLAQNIQHLANRSGRVAQLTKHHVTQVQLDTREVIKAMEECLAGVVRGATYSDEALVRLEEIGRTSERLLKTIELFAHNTQSHVEVSEKIMLQVRANLASSQNMMVSTREINLLIRQLNYLAEQLIVAVSKFRVK
jgi:methyl-accepting chemotaxis protein